MRNLKCSTNNEFSRHGTLAQARSNFSHGTMMCVFYSLTVIIFAVSVVVLFLMGALLKSAVVPAHSLFFSLGTHCFLVIDCLC